MKIIVALTEIIALIVAIIQLVHEIVWITCNYVVYGRNHALYYNIYLMLAFVKIVYKESGKEDEEKMYLFEMVHQLLEETKGECRIIWAEKGLLNYIWC